MLDLLSLSVLGIFVLLAVIAVTVFLRLPGPSRGGKSSMLPAENDILKKIEELDSKLGKIASSENVAKEIETFRKELGSLSEKVASDSTSTPQVTASSLSERIDRALSGIEFLAAYFNIQDGINQYGSRIKDAYDNFIMRIEDEFAYLESGQIQGREYVFRANVLLFSLMMARVYLQVIGPRDSLPTIEGYIERAKKAS